MRSIPLIGAAVLFSLSDAVTAQRYFPATLNTNTTELNARTNYPFQRATNKFQHFYDAAETGTPFLAARLSYRWDGPTGPGGGVGPYTITRLRIFVGTTGVGAAQLGSNFNQNWSTPPTLGFDGAVNYQPQGPLVAGPQPWGAQNGQFIFPMTTPIPVAVPAGGCFGVEMWSEGGTNNSVSNSLLDAHQATPGLVTTGTVAVAGLGCPGGQGLGSTTIVIPVPQAIPGTAMSIGGSGYTSGAPVLTIVGLSNTNAGGIPLPLALPGTNPVCNLYVSLEVLPALTQVAPAGGTFVAYQTGSFLSIPRDPSLNGARFYVQNMSIFAPYAGNPLGISLSNYATVTLGTLATQSHGVWFNGHHLSVTAEAGSFQNSTGYALRVE